MFVLSLSRMPETWQHWWPNRNGPRVWHSAEMSSLLVTACVPCSSYPELRHKQSVMWGSMTTSHICFKGNSTHFRIFGADTWFEFTKYCENVWIWWSCWLPCLQENVFTNDHNNSNLLCDVSLVPVSSTERPMNIKRKKKEFLYCFLQLCLNLPLIRQCDKPGSHETRYKNDVITLSRIFDGGNFKQRFH